MPNAPKHPIEWIPKGGNARVNGQDIGGMVYVGRGQQTNRAGQPNHSAYIDTSKAVSRDGDDDCSIEFDLLLGGVWWFSEI